MARKPYPGDVSDDEWAFIAPYLVLIREDAPQRPHPLRELPDGLRWVVRTGALWRMMPDGLPPWHAVYDQARRWPGHGVFETIAHDFRMILRPPNGRGAQPTAAVTDRRTIRSTPGSGARSGCDGYKRTRGGKAHKAVDTLGHLLALYVTPANEQERDRVELITQEVAAVTGGSVTKAFADQGYAGHQVAEDAASNGMGLVVVGLETARKGFVPLPRRRAIERTSAWAGRFRRLARDHERPPKSSPARTSPPSPSLCSDNYSDSKVRNRLWPADAGVRTRRCRHHARGRRRLRPRGRLARAAARPPRPRRLGRSLRRRPGGQRRNLRVRHPPDVGLHDRGRHRRPGHHRRHRR